MHKKNKNNINDKYDQNIIDALKKLPVPLLTFDNHKVYFDIDKRKETIYEHVANKKHRFHVVDISQIQIILKDKNSLKNDRYGVRYRTYFGHRKKNKEKKRFIKIVTTVKKNKNESIITICTTKDKK